MLVPRFVLRALLRRKPAVPVELHHHLLALVLILAEGGHKVNVGLPMVLRHDFLKFT